VLGVLGIRPQGIVVLKDMPMANASWLAETLAGRRVVLRRYHDLSTADDLAFEHAVLRHLAAAGWVVPEPVGKPCENGGLTYCLTRYVPGKAVLAETIAQRRRRGSDLAMLHLALRDLGERLGQRPGWRAQHAGVGVHTALDWDACTGALTAISPRLGSWLMAAAAGTGADLAAIGADGLPLNVVHGDFAEWNVHYERGRLAGVIDFGLTHLDSRPYELAIARTYRAPEVTETYRAEVARLGWPLSDLEEAAIGPVYRAFRVDIAAWEVDYGMRTGDFDLAAIERHLARTGAALG
jgi:Ser/Thr protein kinase RdoA (MazF antagonist)